MFDFHFVFSNGTTYDVENVQKISFLLQGTTKTVSGDEILSMKLPITDISLYTDNRCVTVSGTNLLVIDISKHIA